MAKTSYVLRALSLLGLDEILKLSEVREARQVPLKKAAGGELIVWNDAPKKSSIHQEHPDEDAKVLPFPQSKSIQEFSELHDPSKPDPVLPGDLDSEPSTFIHSDLVLWQREISRESGGEIKKIDAIKDYQKSTQMYVVKTESKDGKKMRFASTDGILVNKKQA